MASILPPLKCTTAVIYIQDSEKATCTIGRWADIPAQYPS